MDEISAFQCSQTAGACSLFSTAKCSHPGIETYKRKITTTPLQAMKHFQSKGFLTSKTDQDLDIVFIFSEKIILKPRLRFHYRLPAYTANLPHRLSTSKNGATYPPINTKGTVQKNCTSLDKSSSLPSVFCYEEVTSATFHYIRTNSEAQTNQLQLSTLLDVHRLHW